AGAGGAKDAVRLGSGPEEVVPGVEGHRQRSAVGTPAGAKCAPGRPHVLEWPRVGRGVDVAGPVEGEAVHRRRAGGEETGRVEVRPGAGGAGRREDADAGDE